MRNKVVVGSRGSRLALIQAESVADRIRDMNPQMTVSIRKIVTGGDRDRRSRLDHLEGIGIFVKELEEALLDGRIDLAVHSLKDMPTELPEGFCLAAVTRRLDPRDVLISRSRRLDELETGSRIGTGSLRRAVQIGAYRPDLEVCSIRGNVETRLRRVADGDLDGVILAAASMTRLGLEHRINEYLPPEHFLPAVGQGALMIETRLGDEDTTALVAPINHLPAWQETTAERVFLSTLGGGCRAPIAALGKSKGGTLELEGMSASAGGEKILCAREEGDSASPEDVGARLAHKLLNMGASEFIAEVKNRENR
jgi:hydroxymethylbilane synthase